MRSYKGSLKIAATDDIVDAVFVVSDEELEVKTGGDRLGSWPLTDLTLDDTGTEIYLVLDGEDVVVNVIEHDAFVAAINPPKRSRSKHTRKRRERKHRDILGTVRRMLSADTWREWLSSRIVKWVIASSAVVGVAGLALFATESFGMILILLGMAALVIAALAVSEDLSAYSWIPGNLSETTVVIVGAALLALGGLLVLIG